jgi:hypothetical protein
MGTLSKGTEGNSMARSKSSGANSPMTTLIGLQANAIGSLEKSRPPRGISKDEAEERNQGLPAMSFGW